VQLLQKLSIRATNGPDKLMKVIKQPVTMHLPAGCTRVGFSRSAPEVIALPTFVADLPDDQHTLFVVRWPLNPSPTRAVRR
jgi:rRNA small subunit pseudouridine methyltransferase Nep1